jgi:membrane associated rhomboid family serine protease
MIQSMPRAVSRQFGQACRIGVGSVAVLVLVGFLTLLAPGLRAFGIVPRTGPGLVGILFAPLLHANGTHLMANALPLLVLLTVLFWDRHYRPVQTLAMIWMASGVGTWLIGRGNAVHLGASSIIYGLAAYLVAAGLWMRSWRAVAVALAVLVCYGGIVAGLLPQRGPISWEGHLCGALAGIWAARQNHG